MEGCGRLGRGEIHGIGLVLGSWSELSGVRNDLIYCIRMISWCLHVGERAYSGTGVAGFCHRGAGTLFLVLGSSLQILKMQVPFFWIDP